LRAVINYKFAALIRNPRLSRSCIGFGVAKFKRLYSKAIAMCQSARQENPEKSLHYLNLGRIYLMAGHKRSAMATLRQGLKMERNPAIITELKELGVRKPPPLANLSREHLLNRLLGKCLAVTHLR
jgi:tetratricopeptide (TPR) repeat protein